MDIPERLKIAIKESGHNMKEFCILCGIPYTTMQNYVLGERKIGIDALIKINTQMSISVDWLLTGAGDMFIRSSNMPDNNINPDEMIDTLEMIRKQTGDVITLVKRFKRYSNEQGKV